MLQQVHPVVECKFIYKSLNPLRLLNITSLRSQTKASHGSPHQQQQYLNNSTFHPDTTSPSYLADTNENNNQNQNTNNNMIYHNDIQAMMDERKLFYSFIAI